MLRNEIIQFKREFLMEISQKMLYEQADRIAYIYSVAINKFSRLSPERFNRYIYYLYMSHYIDNERYTPNSPNFEYCISYILCEEDLAVYDNFARTQFGQGILDASTSAVSGILGVAGLADDLADSSENLTKLQKIVRNWLTSEMDLIQKLIYRKQLRKHIRYLLLITIK